MRTGVLLLNLGGPDSLRAVKAFLFNLFSDREIIRLGPSFMQRPIAYLVSSLRAKKTEDVYKLIGGKSPLFDITTAQAEALEESLNSSLVTARLSPRAELGPNGSPKSRHGSTEFTEVSSLAFKVYVAMRYWHPLIEEVIPEICDDGIKRLIVLSLFPQYSVTTTGSSISKFRELLSRYPVENFCVPSWFNHPLYIDALVDTIKKGIESFHGSTETSASGSTKLAEVSSLDDIHLLFSAHSLPVKFIEEGDPYVDQIKGTISEITKKINIGWDLSYQSKSGPVQWLEPSTDKMIEELAHKGIKNLLVVPISFVSDHIETLYEIDILYKNMAEELGMKLRRVESLNTSPLFIAALKDIVLKGCEEAGWEG